MGKGKIYNSVHSTSVHLFLQISKIRCLTAKHAKLDTSQVPNNHGLVYSANILIVYMLYIYCY